MLAGSTLLIATTNPGKVREIRRALADLPLRLRMLESFDIEAPEETGRTFAENAALKARVYASASGLPTVAEDSGLSIDALGGRPGVESARYPGETYAEKFANLYRELAPHARPWRARFVCALAFVEPVQTGEATLVFSCEASVEGEIAPAARGAHGFGYDPIFFYPPYGRTLGEVTDQEKLAVSHRGQAFAKFRAWLSGALVAGLALSGGVTVRAQPRPPDLALWRQAVDEHQPGEQDKAAVAISTWPTTTINVLLSDWQVLSRQWRANRLDRIRREQLDTLHIFDTASMTRFVKRAAMLHADVAMLFPRIEQTTDVLSSGTALVFEDGQHVGFRGVGSHWILGRALLDTMSTPANDDMVRRWYIAAGAYMEAERHWVEAIPHLERARELFPTDAQILFLSGVHHEHYASPEIQSAVAGLAADVYRKTSVQSPAVELQTAEELYRRAVAANPGDAEHQLRFGRVTGLLGHHREAIAMMTSAKQALTEPALRYDACLFLGRERHQMKDYESARAEFREAAHLFPDAQSPKLALSQIAGELGDRDGSIRELEAVVTRARSSDAGNDPWLDYMFSHLRTLPTQLRELYQVVPPVIGS